MFPPVSRSAVDLPPPLCSCRSAETGDTCIRKKSSIVFGRSCEYEGLIYQFYPDYIILSTLLPSRIFFVERSAGFWPERNAFPFKPPDFSAHQSSWAVAYPVYSYPAWLLFISLTVFCRGSNCFCASRWQTLKCSRARELLEQRMVLLPHHMGFDTTTEGADLPMPNETGGNTKAT